MTDTSLEALPGLFAGTLANLSPSSRRSVLLKIARILQGSNAANIAAQREADGSPFAPRMTRQTVESSEPRRFLYPSGGTGAPRVVRLNSWKMDGPVMVGFDREAEGLRSFDPAKIIRNLPPLAADRRVTKAKPKRQTIKRKAMFAKLRRFSKLRAGADDNEAWAGFEGSAAAVARVHQEGGLDRAHPKAPLTRYQVRRLLGLSEIAERQIMDLLLEMVDTL